MPESIDAAPVILAERPHASALAAPSRELYIDRLRSVMTAFVILHHTAITYGAVGGWFYNELHPSGSISSLLLTHVLRHAAGLLHGLLLPSRGLLHAGIARA